MSEAPRDQNFVPSSLFEIDGQPGQVMPGQIDEATGRILVDSGGGGSGTVTSVSVVSANGFAGSVANATTTPAITLTTTITGVLKGNGTAISAATANTDYQSPITLTTTGSSGAATFNGTTLNIPQYSGGGTVTSVSGTANRITSTGGATPVIDIAATYVGQNSITTLGTITTGVWNGTAIANANLANSSTTINGTTIALGASGTVTAAAGTLTGTTLNSTVVTSSLTSVGTIATGVWNGTVVAGQYGGTGVANTGKTITVSGNTTIGSSTHTVAFATGANTSVTLPSSGTLATLAGTETLTNKRINKRYVTVTQSATPTINTDDTDVASITGLAQAITSFTTNLSGTPVGGNSLIIQITDDGTARAITWGASFESSTVTLPSTTVISTMLTVGFIWNVATTKWRCVAVA